MAFKFEGLEVWNLAVEYIDLMYAVAAKLPRGEEFNLKSQLRRAATSIALNVAEGSTGQTDAEQARFVGLALRSLLETVACQRLIQRRGYLPDESQLGEGDRRAETLARKLQALRNALSKERSWVREEKGEYVETSS